MSYAMVFFIFNGLTPGDFSHEIQKNKLRLSLLCAIFGNPGSAPAKVTVTVYHQGLTFLLFYLLFFASNLPIKPLEQVKIAWLMLEIDCKLTNHHQ
jgi:hypothetical protein